MTTNYHTPYQAGVTKWRAAELGAPLGELDAQITQNASDIENLQTIMISGFFNKTPGASESLIWHVAGIAFYLPAGLADAAVKSKVAAAAETVLTIKKGVTSIGTATFALGEAVATLAVASNVDFAVGDELEIVGPATPDATLSRITITLVGIRGASS